MTERFMHEAEKDNWTINLWLLSLAAMFWLGVALGRTWEYSPMDLPAVVAFGTAFLLVAVAWLFRVTYLKGRGGNR